MMDIIDIYSRIVDRMEYLVNHAVTPDGEERAFNADEQLKFDALEAAAKALMPAAEKEPNVNELLKAAFERK